MVTLRVTWYPESILVHDIMAIFLRERFSSLSIYTELNQNKHAHEQSRLRLSRKQFLFSKKSKDSVDISSRLTLADVSFFSSAVPSNVT